MNTFLVSLEILSSKDGYAPELIGKTHHLETTDFPGELIGKSINLAISKDKDGYHLMCTDVIRAALHAGDKTAWDLLLKRQPKT
ncbi:MAG TPA: hypothetical protein VK968_05380 [Roseimicrobium sp.]|nr:hypothetical protein [Roseimicrobium sp.]